MQGVLHPADKASPITQGNPQVTQAGKLWFNTPFEQALSAIPVVDVGRMYQDFQDKALGIDQDMPFATFDLLATLIASKLPFSVVLTDWLSIMAALGWGSRPNGRRSFSRNVVLIVSHSWRRRHCR